MPSSQYAYRITAKRWGRWCLGQELTVWAMKVQHVIGAASDLEAFFVHGAVVAAAEQGEVGQRGGPSAGPMADVMALGEAATAAREATALVAGL